MKVLVTLDGSKFAEAVLGATANLAGTSNAEVHLIRVVNPDEVWSTGENPGVGHLRSALETGVPGAVGGAIPEGGGGLMPETRDLAVEQLCREAEEYLGDVAARFFPTGAVTKVVVGDNAAEEIADYASHEKVDLIAIATHGRTGLAKITMGSVAGDLLKARAAPLFMVRPEGLFYATSA